VGLDRVAGHAKGVGDLGHRQLQVVAQHHAVALAPRQVAERVDHRPLFSPDRDLLLDGGRRRVGGWPVAQRHQPAPVVVAGQVEHDRAQVGGGPVPLADAVRRPGQPDERLLDQVLGRHPVVHEEAGQADQRRRLLTEQQHDQGVHRRGVVDPVGGRAARKRLAHLHRPADDPDPPSG
jgi:hypothetical protein